MKTSFFARGKLLLTGEYTVLQGALALAIPTQAGQTFEFYPADTTRLEWTALDPTGVPWQSFQLRRDSTGQWEGDALVPRLLRAAEKIGACHIPYGQVKTQTEFNPHFGWGTSSSLIALVAQWTQVDALALHFATSNGSGYDVVASLADQPILYQKTGPETASMETVSLQHWPNEQLWLLYLGEKQESESAVREYMRRPASNADCEQITRLTRQWLTPLDSEAFQNVMRSHEDITASFLGRPTLQAERFADYPYAIKSLGAWGGDFGLVFAPTQADLLYFSTKGYSTWLPWAETVCLR